ncbi:MAG: hypothetical protein ACOXZO_07200 [Bacteroidales bacterium]|jgi:hypothetical protein
MSSSNCPHFYYWILTGITDGHPSGVDLVLLSFTPDKTGAIGWPALRAGGSLPLSSPGGTGICLLIDINTGVDLVLLSFTPGETGAIGWPALRAGRIITIIVTTWNKDLHNVMEESILNFA